MSEDDVASTSGVGKDHETNIPYHNPSKRSTNLLANSSQKSQNVNIFRRNGPHQKPISSFIPCRTPPSKNGKSSKPNQTSNRNKYSPSFRTVELDCEKESFNGKKKQNLDRSKIKFGFKKLQELSNEQDALKVAVELANTYNGLEYLLAEEDFLKERPDWIILITRLLSKVCECAFPENKIMVLNVVFESQFIEFIVECLHGLSFGSDKDQIELFLNNAYILMETLVNTFPNISKEKLHAPVKQIFGDISCIQQFADFQIDKLIKTNFTELECRLRDMKISYKEYLYSSDPPENFRTFELFPNEEEILTKKNVFLRSNIVNQRYQNVEHYLDIQFRLLREDLMIPLREGFEELIHKLSSLQDRKIKVNYLRYFESCCFKLITTEHNTVSYDVCFDVDRKLDHINWEYNQWFKYGSLVFFSFDNFSTFIIGKVAKKDNEVCQTQRKISVTLIGEKEINVEDFGKPVVMVESTIFFQPYYHVMKALKQFNEKNFPLSRYIIEVNPNIQPPAYLLNNSYMKIGGNKINVLDDRSWPSPQNLSLDPHQYQAFKSALTKEFVIMQGPPGTGKTYLGLKIVETLLNYKKTEIHTLHAPILVVCYTNHALDQFLEGILKFTDSVVRVGSMTKSELIKHYELSQKRNKMFEPSLQSAYEAMRNEMKDIVTQIQMLEHDILQIEHDVGIIYFRHLAPFMSQGHQNQLGTNEKLVQWLLMDDDFNLAGRARPTSTQTYLHSPLDKKEKDDEGEDEDRRDSQNEEDINNSFCRVEKANIHVINLYSLYAEKEKLFTSRYYLEQEFDNIESIQYALKRRDYESKIKTVSFAIENISHEYKKIRFSFNFENLTNLSTNVKRLNKDERWKLYSQWVSNFRCSLMNSMKTLEMKFRSKSEQLVEAKQLEDLNVLRKFEIVGITTTAAAKSHLLLTDLKPSIVVVEEAAEVLEAHIVTALTEHCQHLILIGDHQQLRPNPTVHKLAKEYHLDVSLFERMIKNRLDFCRLGVQHRMRPIICDLIAPTIYPNLENHTSVYTFDDVKGITKNLFFLTHEVEEVMDNTIQSYKNPHEADFILQLVQYLLLQGYSSEEITILTTYSGQLIYLKMQKKNMLVLKDVRVSTVDSYQGEECDIILLSLVRSYSEEKIGFLKISNRVCVALSRARKGLYMIGNMKALTEGSDIWKPIKNKLEEHESIGSQLELMCLNHGNKTLVKDKKDFASVAKGGCSIVCDSLLKCGHNCVRPCHPCDLTHEKNCCQKMCTKSCENCHPCAYQCYQCSKTCKPCLVPIINFQLECGHLLKNILCSKIKTHHCEVKKEVEIELCGHSTLVTCHAVTSGQIKCTKPCDIRLQCGHQCTLTCHIDEDPDHLEFKCAKKCEKLMRGCSQKHYCSKKCSEPCPVCNENVVKTLVCGHQQEVLCHLDAMECLNACNKELECGHPCNKRCKDKCGDCNVFVEKKIPECGHTVRMKCKNIPSIKFCRQACQKKLSCGHSCSNKCNEPCSSSDKCTFLVIHQNLTTHCSHGDVQVPCKDGNISEKKILQDLALKYCKHPCQKILLCGHTCKGNCGECQQSRFHKVCIEKCERVLLCGHKCRQDCSSICPPCQARCLNKCPHKVCKRSCSENCNPCYEKCMWECKHQKCRLVCSESCNRRQCYHPCQKKLKCEHMCIGFCSEPCPDKCRVCDVDEVTAEFFGSEKKEDARFVVLEDCGHFFESNGIEKYLGVKTNSSNSQTSYTEITVKTCPKCKTPITSTLRFMNTLKFIKRNLGAAKFLLNKSMSDDQIPNQKMALIRRIRSRRSTFIPAGSKYLGKIQENILNQLEDYARGKNKKWTRSRFVSADQLRLFTFLVDCIECLETGFAELFEKTLPIAFQTLLVDQVDWILWNAMNIPNNRISQQLKFDYFCEIERFYALLNLVSLRMDYIHLVESPNETTLEQMWKDSKTILCNERFNKELSARVSGFLDHYKSLIVNEIPSGSRIQMSLRTPDPALWQDQREMKMRVFKCSNKHMFCVPDNGREEFTCIQCISMTGRSGIGVKLWGFKPPPRQSGNARNARGSYTKRRRGR